MSWQSKDLNHIVIAPNFCLDEFACKCCKAVMIDPKMLRYLQCTRDLLKCPVAITSGYRCIKHNTEVNGHPDSGHMAGRCVDVLAPHVTRKVFMDAVQQVGWPHIKEYSNPTNFFHLGV